MAKSDFIDLGIKPQTKEKVADKPRPYYPSIVISGYEKDLEVGDEVILRGVVTEERNGQNGSSCTIEVTGLKPEGSDDLEGAMKKIARKKSKESDEY
jgi:hypothetical protein